MRIGIDWGGTKIELIALNNAGETLMRERIATPKGDYEACVNSVRDLVLKAETQLGMSATVGVGIPGTLSPATGLVKNSNSVCMNGKLLLQDLSSALNRDVRIQNDANCFAVSEAIDGAAMGAHVVCGIIIGTGCGCGIAINGKAHFGRSGIAGEFGHTALSPLYETDIPLEICWCGKEGCLETYISGSGFQRDYDKRAGGAQGLTSQEILALDNPQSLAAFEVYIDRLARGLSTLVNIIDPDVIVLGGGMSNISALYERIPDAITPYVFTDYFDTPILKAKYGDSSGVRGAAWLW